MRHEFKTEGNVENLTTSYVLYWWYDRNRPPPPPPPQHIEWEHEEEIGKLFLGEKGIMWEALKDEKDAASWRRKKPQVQFEQNQN